mgnify:CR=1 FL=1
MGAVHERAAVLRLIRSLREGLRPSLLLYHGANRWFRAKGDRPCAYSSSSTTGCCPIASASTAPEAYQLDGHPVRSFPIEIADVPEGARSLALTFLDYDAVPVGGFCWIHWLACDIAPDTTLVPENASASGELACVQGSNSDWSPLAGSHTDPRIIHRYAGPYPPDKTHDYTLTVYALDCELGLSEGYFLNEFRRAVRGHVLDEASLELPSRA